MLSHKPLQRPCSFWFGCLFPLVSWFPSEYKQMPFCPGYWSRGQLLRTEEVESWPLYSSSWPCSFGAIFRLGVGEQLRRAPPRDGWGTFAIRWWLLSAVGTCFRRWWAQDGAVFWNDRAMSRNVKKWLLHFFLCWNPTLPWFICAPVLLCTRAQKTKLIHLVLPLGNYECCPYKLKRCFPKRNKCFLERKRHLHLCTENL